MANPGHALAATNLAEITVLKTEIAMLKREHKMNIQLLAKQIKALALLLKKKGVISENEAVEFEYFEVGLIG
ncbi:MAG: hypothetical protein JRD47_00210 [Deltaproteobacteria bacterium]|nr:hypothetical protein [Deltaproteobacteria bacterium]MBW2318363.1 hypothetical protein [Deltaproteobacteria bacterium]MBW2600342.1 hypothetical protein [Deltaproteobacteria bacterium]OEU45059.1 MAG: hypothetical protein BBJ60_09405 [Desulfobacterales bacterium S7086C20]